jgi:23S rRNA pseudouridine1911/1915/1917 synthase
MHAPETILVPEESAGERLDKFMAARFPDRSRGAWQDAISAGHVTLNGRVTTPHHAATMPDNDADRQITMVPRPDITLRVAFEDAALAVIEKPSGMLMHPAIPTDTATLAHAAIARWPQMATVGESPERPGIMQRLDKEASGLVVLAKIAAAYDDLKRQFQKHDITKEYLVLVSGVPSQESGTVTLAIGRKAGQGRMSARPAAFDGDRPAVTHYEVVEHFANAALLRVRTETGRTHQIRAHMKALGCPVAGDEVYGTPAAQRLSPRLFLHATTLGFVHPATKKPMEFVSALPQELENVLAKLRTK